MPVSASRGTSLGAKATRAEEACHGEDQTRDAGQQGHQHTFSDQLTNDGGRGWRQRRREWRFRESA